MRKLRRRILIVVAMAAVALAVSSVVGATQLFLDVANFGHGQVLNRFESAPRAKVIDLQLATFSLNAGQGSCGTYTDDTTSGLINFTGQEGDLTSRAFCVKNVGGSKNNESVTLKLSAGTNVGSVETGCTNDEQTFDATCGTGAGEIDQALVRSVVELDCANGEPFQPESWTPLFPPTLLLTGALATPRCYRITVRYDAGGDESLAQATQSDALEFSLGFVGEFNTP